MAANKLAGKVAVITGAASTLGQAIARRFVGESARVILVDTNGQTCQNLVASINHNRNVPVAYAMTLDVGDPNSILAAVEAAKTQYKQDVDIFYNNAAVKNEYSPYSSIDMTTFNNTMSVNVQSVIASIKHAGDAMRTKGGGVILCTGSTVGAHGDVVPSAYNISKAAVIGVVRAAAAELEKHGVRVNAISPHGLAARFDKGLLKQIFPRASDRELENMITYYGANKVTEDDVANAAVYLASSEHGKSINGQNLVLNGNFTL